jgi:serine O-acetyltransferase
MGPYAHTSAHTSLAAEADLSGVANQNPTGIGLRDLLAEDFRTHDRNAFDPALWAVIVHRLGNARMDVRPKLLRLPLSAIYRFLYTAQKWMWGIDFEYTVKLGRRVRLWHHGGMVIGARRIGNDVHIRHNVTLGIAKRGEPDEKPVVDDGVEIGVGAVIVGAVRLGRNCVVAPNSLVMSSVPPGWTVVGVPARPVCRTSRADET